MPRRVLFVWFIHELVLIIVEMPLGNDGGHRRELMGTYCISTERARDRLFKDSMGCSRKDGKKRARWFETLAKLV